MIQTILNYILAAHVAIFDNIILYIKKKVLYISSIKRTYKPVALLIVFVSFLIYLEQFVAKLSPELLHQQLSLSFSLHKLVLFLDLAAFAAFFAYRDPFCGVLFLFPYFSVLPLLYAVFFVTLLAAVLF